MLQESEFAAPPSGAVHRSGAPGRQARHHGGEASAAIVREKLRDHISQDPGAARILDFGAGAGRVALALDRLSLPPTDACDVDGAALAALSRELPHVRCLPNAHEPPLPYASGTFDAVYAVSVLSRLPPSVGLAWLRELARVLKEGGVALVSVCGPGGLRHRRESAQPGWSGVLDEDLARNGVLFMPFETPAPGAREHGAGACSHEHILETWGGVLAVEAIYPEIVEGVEDLVVLRRVSGAAAGRRRKGLLRRGGALVSELMLSAKVLIRPGRK